MKSIIIAALLLAVAAVAATPASDYLWWENHPLLHYTCAYVIDTTGGLKLAGGSIWGIIYRLPLDSTGWASETDFVKGGVLKSWFNWGFHYEVEEGDTVLFRPTATDRCYPVCRKLIVPLGVPLGKQ